MAKPFLSDDTKKRIDHFLAKPTHGILLEGKTGVGLKTIALDLAAQLGASRDEIQLIAPDEKGTIAIERIRQLYTLTRASHDTARVVIIDDAEAMGGPAQNALLKVLEEPTAQTYFILTSHVPGQLLPTITSRVQTISVAPLPAQVFQDLITNSDPAVKAQLNFMASGLPAELARLQADDAYFNEKVSLMKDARSFLEGSQYERLIFIKQYGTDRSRAIHFLECVLSVLKFTLFRQKRPELTDNLELVDTIISRLQANAHSKTQLMYLVTKLS